MEDTEIKQEPDDFYDSRLEPDVVILDDSVSKSLQTKQDLHTFI